MINIKKSLLIFCTVLGIIQGKSLEAEIDEVTITWTAGLCSSSCVKGLYDQFRKIPGVKEISINQSQGQAFLRWQPNASFSYQPVEVAMALIGLYVNNIKVKVRGTIVNDSPGVYNIVSIGDSTSFTLMAIPTPQRNQYVDQYSPYNRQLSPEMVKQLQQAQQKQQIATISGPLFMPWRSPPLYLVIENIQFSDQ